MKYTEEEVIDIIRSYNSNLTAEESLEQWNIKKSNTYDGNHICPVFEFPIIIDNNVIGKITLFNVYNVNNANDLIMKYLGYKDYISSWKSDSFKHFDITCYLTFYVEDFELPEVVKGFHMGEFNAIDADKKQFNYYISYDTGSTEYTEIIYKYTSEDTNTLLFRFYNGVNIQIEKFENFWQLGQKIKENIKNRLS
jgi:hypothetical protein